MGCYTATLTNVWVGEERCPFAETSDQHAEKCVWVSAPRDLFLKDLHMLRISKLKPVGESNLPPVFVNKVWDIKHSFTGVLCVTACALQSQS